MKASFALCSKRVWRTDDRSSQRLTDKATDLIAKGTDLGPDLRLVHFFIPSFIYLSIFFPTVTDAPCLVLKGGMLSMLTAV